MKVRRQAVVHLGYGRYFRADHIVGLVPIEDNRGPGRRTYVYTEGRLEPIVASRTEETILRDMVRVPPEVMEARAARELLEDLLADLAEVGPMLRRSILEEAQLDLDDIERRITRVLAEGDSQDSR